MFLKIIALFLAWPLLVSCNSRPSPVEDLPPVANLVPDPERMPRAPAEAPGQVSVRQILCAYRGAKDALRKIGLTRAEAKTRAEHILKLARARGQDFAELAKKYSDDSNTSLDGGNLGTVARGQLHPDLEQAAFGLGPGQVSPVTEGPRGFHILERHPPTEFQAAVIVVAYTGAEKYTPRAPRSRKEARHLGDQIKKRLESGSAFFEEARVHSDHPSHVMGGVYPIFTPGSYHPKLEEIVFGLRVGETSAIVETVTGFHIVKRLPVRRIQIRQIQIGFQPPGETQGPMKRTKTEALARAHVVHGLALKPGSDFTALAAEYSDGPAAKRGGINEPFGRGRRPYDFEKTAFALDTGEISGVIETETGIFIIKRIH